MINKNAVLEYGADFEAIPRSTGAPAHRVKRLINRWMSFSAAVTPICTRTQRNTARNKPSR